jgi:hypothetical protein
MPKKLNISSNERVDLEDFSRASSDYTQESGNFARTKLIQARKTAVASGFRVEISDQAASPGEFTIYNGVGLDRDGNILNNEQQITDARTLTLSGTSVSYYVEVEFVESESDVGSRAFWDPTYSGNIPPGKEFNLNVATRLTPDWQLVSPVNSSAFEITGSPNSNRIPIAILTLDGTGLISGFTKENIASSLEEDALGDTYVGTVTQFKVLDSSLFPTSGTGSLGFGTAEAEGVTITGNDRTNGLITVSVPLINDHNAGAVFLQTTVPAAFVPEDKAAVPASEEDRRSRLFAGNENRGVAVSADPQDSSLRADLQVTSLKNYVDFLAAQLRELKFGNPRTDINSTAPPSDFSSTRHYDNAGSVTGARTATITIGDGTSSFGDFNFDALNTSLTTAITALDATFGGTIYVKAGTYAWGLSAVSFNRPVNLVFDKGVEFAGTFTNNWITLVAGHEGSSIKNMPAAPAADNPMLLTSAVATDITVDKCTLRMLLSYTGATKNYIKVTNSILESNQTSVSAITMAGFSNVGDHAIFEDCTIRYNHTVDNLVYYLVDTSSHQLSFNRCVFDAAYNTGHIRGYVDSTYSTVYQKLAFTNCDFIDTNTAEVDAPFKLVDSAANVTSSALFDNCTFDMNWDPAASTEAARTLLFFDNTAGTVTGCDFTAMGAGRIGNTSLGNEGHIVSFNNSSGNGVVSNCKFGVYVNGGAPVDGFVCQVTSTDDDSAIQITNNIFASFYKAINCTSSDQPASIQVDNNQFLIDTQGEVLDKNCYGIYNSVGIPSTDPRITVSNNQFDFLFYGGTGVYEAVGVNVQDEQKAIITGNRFSLITELEAIYSIRLEDNAGESLECTISDNSIYQTAYIDPAHAKDNIGIQLNMYGTGPASRSRLVVSDNNITCSSDGTGSTYGIDLDGANTENGDSVQTITGNALSVGSLGGTLAACAAIRVLSNNVSISGNSTRSYRYGASGAVGFGIYAKGHNLTVTGNTCRNDSITSDSCIYVGSAVDDATNGLMGNLIISNNNCYNLGASPAIHMELVTGADLENFIINGNNVIWDGPATYASYTLPSGLDTSSDVACGILMQVSGASSPGAMSISNNNVRILQEPSADHWWNGIFVTGTAYGEGPGGQPTVLSMCGNTVSRLTGTQSLGYRGHAIKVEAPNQITFIGNICHEWSISGGNEYPIFDISGTTAGAYIGNVVIQSATVATSQSLEFGTYGVAVGNVDRLGDGTISAGANVLLKSGSYNDLV